MNWPSQPLHAVGQDSDLMWPAAIKRGRGKFALFFGPIELPH